MRFIHEPLARILRATSIPRYDFNKLIDCVIAREISDRTVGLNWGEAADISEPGHCQRAPYLFRSSLRVVENGCTCSPFASVCMK